MDTLLDQRDLAIQVITGLGQHPIGEEWAVTAPATLAYHRSSLDYCIAGAVGAGPFGSLCLSRFDGSTQLPAGLPASRQTSMHSTNRSGITTNWPPNLQRIVVTGRWLLQ